VSDFTSVGRPPADREVSTNYFAEVEQIGFDPAQMPPGIEPSEDPTLQARMFAYGDAQRYRIGKMPIDANALLNNTLPRYQS
jgi:catalase